MSLLALSSSLAVIFHGIVLLQQPSFFKKKAKVKQQYCFTWSLQLIFVGWVTGKGSCKMTRNTSPGQMTFFLTSRRSTAFMSLGSSGSLRQIIGTIFHRHNAYPDEWYENYTDLNYWFFKNNFISILNEMCEKRRWKESFYHIDRIFTDRKLILK